MSNLNTEKYNIDDFSFSELVSLKLILENNINSLLNWVDATKDPTEREFRKHVYLSSDSHKKLNDVNIRINTIVDNINF